jgi:uncharacterized Ntn-hydrolase superfamily protein
MVNPVHPLFSLEPQATPRMTLSLIALNRETGELGIALATRFLAAGAHVPFIAAGVGAIATQALLNPYYGIDGLRLLREGCAPDEVLDVLTSADAGRDHRQAHVLDIHGRVAAHTGRSCLNWAGHCRGEEFSAAGTMLTGPEVLEQTSEGYLRNPRSPFARRLISAMQAGEAASHDRRGRRSAALVIYANEEWASLDMRVDDHPDPVCELDRLERVSREEWIRYRPFVPTRTNPAGVTDHKTIDAALGSPMHDV